MHLVSFSLIQRSLLEPIFCIDGVHNLNKKYAKCDNDHDNSSNYGSSGKPTSSPSIPMTSLIIMVLKSRLSLK